MANLSKLKRDEMLSFLNKLRKENREEDWLYRIKQIEDFICQKKYGLVWDEYIEKIDEIIDCNIPVFKELKDRKIISDEHERYNFLLEGDNLHSLKMLEKTHRGKIDVIYIDPPYNTGNKDFIYNDDFMDKTEECPHSKWLSFMYKRLKIAKKLLSDNGVLFISLDDNEYARLKLLCDSIFCEDNYVSSFIRKTKSMTGDDGNGLNIQHEYLITYALKKNKLLFTGEKKTFDSYSNPDNDPNGIWCSADPSAKSGGQSTYFPIKNPYTGFEDYPPKGRYWAFSKDTLEKYIATGRIKFKKKYAKGKRGFIFKRYAQSMRKIMPVGTLFAAENAYMNASATSEVKKIIGPGSFHYPKPEIYIRKLIKYSSSKESIILDFFAGSGTTGHAVVQLNKEDGGKRTYILCTNNENNICEEVTYKRLKNIQEYLPHNLKYYRADFISGDMADNLCLMKKYWKKQ